MVPFVSRSTSASISDDTVPLSTVSTAYSVADPAGSVQAIRVVAIGPNVMSLPLIVYEPLPVLQPVSSVTAPPSSSRVGMRSGNAIDDTASAVTRPSRFHVVPSSGRSGSATDWSRNVTTVPSLAAIVSSSPSTAIVGLDVRSAVSQVSWSMSDAGWHAIIVIAGWATTRVSPSSDHVEEIWLHPPAAAMFAPLNVSWICEPSTSW